MKILITGGNGYIARSLHRALQNEYDVTSINRNDVDLTDACAVKEWFTGKQFDVVIHTAIQGGSRLKPDTISVLDNNLRMFYNVLDHSDKYQKFINIGSGAEIYAQHTPYGFSKHIIKTSLMEKERFYNIRVFAVFDEHELDTRFIKRSILNYIEQKPIQIYENKLMDFFYMEDFVKVIKYYIENDSPPKEFDCTYDRSYSLIEIANFINTLDKHTVSIEIENAVWYGGGYIGIPSSIHMDYVGLHKGIQTVYNKLSCKTSRS